MTGYAKNHRKLLAQIFKHASTHTLTLAAIAIIAPIFCFLWRLSKLQMHPTLKCNLHSPQ